MNFKVLGNLRTGASMAVVFKVTWAIGSFVPRLF